MLEVVVTAGAISRRAKLQSNRHQTLLLLLLLLHWYWYWYGTTSIWTPFSVWHFELTG